MLIGECTTMGHNAGHWPHIKKLDTNLVVQQQDLDHYATLLNNKRTLFCIELYTFPTIVGGFCNCTSFVV